MEQSPQLQELINALLLYMDQDACVCETTGTCPVDCTACMFCTAVATLTAIGYYEVKHDARDELHPPV